MLSRSSLDAFPQATSEHQIRTPEELEKKIMSTCGPFSDFNPSTSD
jgi:hypothetical protein